MNQTEITPLYTKCRNFIEKIITSAVNSDKTVLFNNLTLNRMECRIV